MVGASSSSTSELEVQRPPCDFNQHRWRCMSSSSAFYRGGVVTTPRSATTTASPRSASSTPISKARTYPMSKQGKQVLPHSAFSGVFSNGIPTPTANSDGSKAGGPATLKAVAPSHGGAYTSIRPRERTGDSHDHGYSGAAPLPPSPEQVAPDRGYPSLRRSRMFSHRVGSRTMARPLM